MAVVVPPGENMCGDEAPFSIEREAVSDGVYANLTALPMGFSWSVYFVQAMHEQRIRHAGLPESRCLVSSWPSPDSREGPIRLPYCDNLSVIGLDPVEVRRQLARIMPCFTDVGFELHEREWARSCSTPLGSNFSGDTGTVGPKDDDTW